MPQQHSPHARAHRPCRKHVVTLLRCQCRRARHPAECHSASQRKREDHVQDARAEHRRDQNGEQNRGECELDIRQPHEDDIDPAAEVSRNHAGHQPNQAGDQDRGATDEEENPCTLQNLSEKPLTDLIRAQPGSAAIG